MEITVIFIFVISALLYVPPYLSGLVIKPLIPLYLLFPVLPSTIFIYLSGREIGVLRKFCLMTAAAIVAVVALEDLIYITNMDNVLRLLSSDYMWIGVFPSFYQDIRNNINKLKIRESRFYIISFTIIVITSGGPIAHNTSFGTIMFLLKLVLCAPWLYLFYNMKKASLTSTANL